MPGPYLVYRFPTTEANAVIGPFRLKAMPVILATNEQCEVWMRTL